MRNSLNDVRSINLGCLADNKARIQPARVAIVGGSGAPSVTYADLKERSDACAAYLRSKGVESSHTVAVITTNRAEFFDLILACAKLGAILVPINFRLSDSEIDAILKSAGAKIIFCDEPFALKASALAREGRQLLPIQDYADYPAEQAPTWPPTPVDSPLCLIYTSGSSGVPKGVIQTHVNIFFQSLNSVLELGLTYNDVILVVAPLFHVAGLNALALPAFQVGAKLVLQRRFEPDETLRIIEEQRITVFGVTPTMLRMLLDAPTFKDRSLTSLRFVAAGGEPLEPELQARAQRFGMPVLNVFGMTEITDGVIFQRTWDCEPDGSTGRPATHAMVRIGSPNVDSPEPEVGELFIGGPIVSPGYWQAPELTRETFADGWVATGDLARRDEAGRITLVGRIDDMIKSGAEKIAPAELERVISAIEGVEHVVVFGIPHPKWGSAPKAVVALKPGAHVTEGDVVAACVKQLARYKKPASVVFVDELPRTGSGKVDRTAVKNTYAE